MKTVITAFLLCISLASFSQFKVIAEGPVFEEPESGFSKVLQLKNGNTAFFHITFKDGINVKIYDAKHKQKVVKQFEPSYGKLKQGSIEGIFEVSGDVTILVSEIDSKRPVLYRLIVDGKTGELKEDKQIAELMKYSLGQGYAMAFGGVTPPDFYVRKDPSSDHYAVAMMNSFESDRNKRIEVVYYGPGNKEVSRAFYSSPDNKYKYMRYVDMTVMKDKVSILAYAYNTRSSGGKESELVLADLDAGSSKVVLHELDFSKDLVISGGITRYNPVTRKIILLATAVVDKKKNIHTCFLAMVDPFAKKIEKVREIYPVYANEKSLALFGKKREYTGMPQNLFINKDGSFSVVFEEIKLEYVSNGRYTVTHTLLGNIAVMKFDIEGRETGSYLVPKSHKLTGTALSPFYHSAREGTAQNLVMGNQFKSFAYLNGDDKTFILFNDVERNGESVMKGKLTTIQGVSDCDAFYYNIEGVETMPAREFVFGKPESKRSNNFGLFSISDYNPGSNVYVTLKLEKEGRDKGVKVVWLQP